MPDSGTVEVDGYDIRREPDTVKGMIGYVPDYFGVYDNLKVSEYMEFFRFLLWTRRVKGAYQDYDAVRTGGAGRSD